MRKQVEPWENALVSWRWVAGRKLGIRYESAEAGRKMWVWTKWLTRKRILKSRACLEGASLDNAETLELKAGDDESIAWK